MVALTMAYPRSLYVHMPFCRQRCHYCDFPIAVVQDGALKSEAYVDVVLRELDHLEGNELVSCYVGGGTPSLASPETIGRLLDAINRKFGFERDAEITLEADPGTFDALKLEGYLNAGITRLSIGVQSFQDPELLNLGRAHDKTEAYEAAKFAAMADLKHGWSMDLISGVPGQTLDSWSSTLDTAIALNPMHISAYDLQIQSGTAFGSWYAGDREVLFGGDEPVVKSNRTRPALPSEDTAAEMYVMTSSRLQDAGFEHYEISSFARPSFRSIHNSRYWLPGGAWHAVGLGAASAKAVGSRYPASRRFSRPRTMAQYLAYVDTLSSSHDDEEPIQVADALADDVMTSLRTSTGLDLDRVRRFAP